jgi:hypothetical protein
MTPLRKGMKSEFQRLAQETLNAAMRAGLDPDGDFGGESVKAARVWVGHLPVDGVMTNLRWAALVIQHAANRSQVVPHRVEEDGWWGPVTEDAAYRMLGHVFVRPDEAAASPAAASPVRCWTPTDARMMEAYGSPGSGQVVVTLPFPLRLDWDLDARVTRTSCHRKVADGLVLALEEIHNHYGLDEIRRLGIDRFGGILNVRKKRGGSTWSAHAWGTAIDLWPSMNQLAWKKTRAVFARGEYQALHDAFARQGWMSLGKCYDFDWMHWQRNP